jgi:hypothetical protein
MFQERLFTLCSVFGETFNLTNFEFVDHLTKLLICQNSFLSRKLVVDPRWMGAKTLSNIMIRDTISRIIVIALINDGIVTFWTVSAVIFIFIVLFCSSTIVLRPEINVDLAFGASYNGLVNA